MDLEKLIARARSILVLISLLGLMITAAGVVLTIEVASWQGDARGKLHDRRDQRMPEHP